LKDYYQLLEVMPTASAEEVKRAFRLQIARYHPDKVQHLGKEFQDMAAERAAELTEAYRILSDQTRREEYDSVRRSGVAAQPGRPAAPAAAATAEPAPFSPPGEAAPPPPVEEERQRSSGQFSQERATRDEFVRKAIVGRFRQALVTTMGACDETPVSGFDITCVPKPKLFARRKDPRILARFVPAVDGEAVAAAWTLAAKWKVPAGEEIGVFLIGSSMAPPRELADAIAKQRKQQKPGVAKVIIIPVDARNWDAHIPTDAPALVRTLLDRLRGGA
jgi:hypothetical protein